MALNLELENRLRYVEDEPASKRFCLARKVFLIPSLPFQRKEEIVISWLTDFLPSYCRGKSDLNDDEGNSLGALDGWRTLSLCLSSSYLDVLGGSEIRPSVKKNLFLMLTSCLENPDKIFSEELRAILECCLTVLESSSMQHYLRSEIELHTTFLKTIFAALKVNGNPEMSVKAVKSIQVYNRQVWCPLFAEHVLIPLIELCVNQGDLFPSLKTEIVHCIQQIFFPKSLAEFPKLLSEVFKEEKDVVDPLANLPPSKDKHLVPLILLEVLNKSSEHLNENVYICLCETIFRSFVASQSTAQSSAIFGMVVAICYTNGVCVKSTKSKINYKHLEALIPQVTMAPLPSSYAVINGMLSILFHKRVPTDSSILGISFLDWLQGLVEVLFPKKTVVNKSMLELLTAFLKLNPLTVEPYGKQLLHLLASQPLKDDSQKALEDFLISMLSMYMKLNRIHIFISLFFSSLKEGFIVLKNSFESAPPTSCQVWIQRNLANELTKCATTMPSASTIAALDALLNQLDSNCIEPIKLVSSSESHSVDGYLVLLLKGVVDFICALLSGARLLEQSLAPLPRTGYSSVLARLQDSLAVMGELILQGNHHNGELVRAFMKMTYFWAEEISLIKQYCCVGRDELLGSLKQPSHSTKNSSGNFMSYLHSYLTGKQWKKLIKQVECCEEQECSNLMTNLQMQSISAHLMFEEQLEDSVKEMAVQATEGIKNKLKGEMQDLDDFNRSIAEDINLLAPLLDEAQLVSLGECLYRYISSNFGTQQVQVLLLSLREQRGLMCAIACTALHKLKKLCRGYAVWDHCRKLLKQIDSSFLTKLESNLGKVESDDGGVKLQEIVTSMALGINEAIRNHDSIETSYEKWTDLNLHLKILQSLPIQFFCTGVQQVFFLALLGIAVTSSRYLDSADKQEALSTVYLHLLLGMVERGSNFASKTIDALNYGQLISHLAFNGSTYQLLLEELVMIALRRDSTLQQVMENSSLLRTKEVKFAGEEDILLATLLMKDIFGKGIRLRKFRKSSGNQETADSPLEKIKEVRKALATRMCILVEKELVSADNFLLAYSLTLDYHLKLKLNAEPLVSRLSSFCNKAVSILKDELSEEAKEKESAAQNLIKVILTHYPVLKDSLPKTFIRDIWSVMLSEKQPEAALSSLLFETVSQEDMELLMADLRAKCDDAYLSTTSNSKQVKVDLVQLLDIILNCQNLPAVNSEVCCRTIRYLLERLYLLQGLNEKKKLEFLQKIVTSNRLPMDMQMVDNCFLVLSEVILPSARTDFIVIGREYLSVLSSLVLHREHLALDCLPSLFQRLRNFLVQLARHSKEQTELSRAEASDLASLAFGAEKLVNILVKPDKKNALKRVAAYLISDLIGIFEEVTICLPVKVHYQNMVYGLLNLLDQHALKFLLRNMTAGSNEILRNLQDGYKKFYKFTGKV